MKDEYVSTEHLFLASLEVKNSDYARAAASLGLQPDDVLKALWEGSQVAMEKLVAGDPMAAKVYASFQSFYEGVRAYHHISEQAYINARDRVMDGHIVEP